MTRALTQTKCLLGLLKSRIIAFHAELEADMLMAKMRGQDQLTITSEDIQFALVEIIHMLRMVHDMRKDASLEVDTQLEIQGPTSALLQGIRALDESFIDYQLAFDSLMALVKLHKTQRCTPT